MKWTFVVFFALIWNFNAQSMTPPDSTNSLVDRGTAQYFISEGKRLYNENNYKLAILKFREALVKDKNNPTATYWLGECHFALGNYEKAKDQVEKAIELKPDVFVEASNLLGLSYHRLGNLDKAIENFQKALGILTGTKAKELKVQFHLDECILAKEMMKNPVDVKIKNLSIAINSAFHEYGATLSPDGKVLYFVSRRADNRGGGTSSGDNGYFEDIYVSIWDEDKKAWTEASNTDDLINRVNTAGFDAVSQISPDGEYLYLTINTEGLGKAARKPKTKHSDLFVCRLNSQGEWNSPKPVGKSVNSIAFDASSCVSPDGKVMYFVSERPGTKGGSDIYYCYKIGKDWSKPENLGDVINTPGQETTVWTVGDGKTIFFSSTGHKGMGGYDIYMSKKENGRWTEPMNLGYPINTVSDETHFKYYPDKNVAYYSTFSSEGNKGMGARDIFEVDMSNYKFP
ncbi:MAG: tetratricopeptide repeat protein [Flavobacteriales bacterium]|nr:tetratricopeptide repeat protein [Flavobacteriales bacterium]